MFHVKQNLIINSKNNRKLFCIIQKVLYICNIMKKANIYKALVWAWVIITLAAYINAVVDIIKHLL